MHLLPKVYRTEGDIVDFNPSKILSSLMKETAMSEEDASRITEFVARRIISSGIKFLSGPHIREIVCSILSEQHFDQERKLYTRIGMPLMDYEMFLEEKFSGMNPEKIYHKAANRISKEYTLLRILDEEESKAHLYGDIHIHKLKYFDLRPLSQIWDPRIIFKYGFPPSSKNNYFFKSSPAKTLRTAVNQLAKWLIIAQGEFSGEQRFNFITIYLAPYAKGLNNEEINLEMKNLIYDINHLSTIISQDIPTLSISCCPAILKLFSEIPAIGPFGKIVGVYGDYKDQCLNLFNIITKIFKEGDYNGNKIVIPKHIIYIKKNWLKKYDEAYFNIIEEIIKMKTPYLINLCSNWLNNKIEGQYSKDGYHNYGTLQNISLNLPRYAYLGKDEDEFLEILRNKINLCSGILIKKYEIIQKRLKSNHLPLCSSTLNNQQPLFKLEDQNIALNLVGLNETVKFLTNYELHEQSEAFDFGKKIIKKMKKICSEMSERDKKKYVLQENISNKVSYRFAQLDLKHFPKFAIPQINKKGSHYTNSTQFRENIEMDLYEMLYRQGEFNEIIQNDQIINRISLKNVKKKSHQELKEFIKNVCINSKIACLKFES